jgi:cobalt/nickel transport system permease protein
MHISEGVLAAPVLAAGAVLTLAGTAYGLKKLDPDRIPQTALLSSAFFLASFVHVPVGPTSVHLVLNGLMGILLGWTAVPAILIALALQAVLFQYGGLTGLGVNTFNMAAPAILVHFVFGGWIRSETAARAGLAGFLAGASAILVSGLAMGLSLDLSGQSFRTVALAAIAAHLPVMVIEGLITMALVQFLRKVRPEVLQGAVAG